MNLERFKGTINLAIPLHRFTTWKIGGIADMVVIPQDKTDLEILVYELSKTNTPWFILGNGSNILFSDNGYRGAVIILGDGFKHISTEDSMIRAGAAASLHQLAQKTAQTGLAGLEELAGIPGTVGGAAFVNAGAHGKSLMDYCTAVHGINALGKQTTLTTFRPEYRSGGLPDNFIITDIDLKLTFKNPSEIHALMTKYLEKRRSTQPLADASAGCTFKNPDNRGAGRLIDELGLKGFQKGRAMISSKHANFIINIGEAKASDVIDIIRHVRMKVWKSYGVRLQLEVLIIDEYGNPQNPGRIP